MDSEWLGDEARKMATGAAEKVGTKAITAGVTGVGIWLWGKKNEAIQRVSAIRRSLSPRIKGGKVESTRLLIIGPPGVGKTTIGQMLSGAFDDALDIPGAYQESLGVESYTLRNVPRVEATVPPGQPHRRYYWDDVKAKIVSGEFDGIILLSSFGFHSIGEFYQLSPKGPSDPEFLGNYLARCQSDEIAVLDELMPFLSAAKNKCWLLHLVTKQDLWWDLRQSAIVHYRDGEYGERAKRVRQGDCNFRQEFAFGSVVIGNFTTSNGAELARTAAGYEQRLQVESMRRFWEILGSLQEFGGK